MSAPPLQKSALVVAAVSGFLAVCLGAFGAHGLADLLEENRAVAIWQTAVDYQFYHTLALLALAFAPLPAARVVRVVWAWTIGILIFSGSLYLLGITGLRWLGAITPIGGTAFLVGWFLLLLAALRSQKP